MTADLAACEEAVRALGDLATSLDHASGLTARLAARADDWSAGFIGQAADAHADSARTRSAELAEEADDVRAIAGALRRFTDGMRAVQDADPDVRLEREGELGEAWLEALWRYRDGFAIPGAEPVSPPLVDPTAPSDPEEPEAPGAPQGPHVPHVPPDPGHGAGPAPGPGAPPPGQPSAAGPSTPGVPVPAPSPAASQTPAASHPPPPGSGPGPRHGVLGQPPAVGTLEPPLILVSPYPCAGVPDVEEVLVWDPPGPAVLD
ncbi:hypothetical protein [Nocardioides sp. GXZ039]|uniref:hypothetical protein n=1 Tax=Nocardioides sp. GXZ039 TaxID=3136018 RepID=UPI0030F39168